MTILIVTFLLLLSYVNKKVFSGYIFLLHTASILYYKVRYITNTDCQVDNWSKIMFEIFKYSSWLICLMICNVIAMWLQCMMIVNDLILLQSKCWYMHIVLTVDCFLYECHVYLPLVCTFNSVAYSIQCQERGRWISFTYCYIRNQQNVLHSIQEIRYQTRDWVKYREGILFLNGITTKASHWWD